MFAFGVQDFGLFWVMTSGNVPVFSAYWFNTGCMSANGGFGRFSPIFYVMVDLGSRSRCLVLFTLVLSAMLGSTVASGDDFVEKIVFSAMLGSTLDTWCCQSTWPFHRCSCRTRFSCPAPEMHHSGGAAGAAHHQGHLHPCRDAEFDPHGSDCSAAHRDSTVAVL